MEEGIEGTNDDGKIKLILNKRQPFQSPRDTLAFPLANEFHLETRVRAI